jgi:FkbM family methyltransferase
MSLPLAPRKGKLEYPGKSVLDALWSTGSWSVRETSIAELILSSFCSSESLGGASGVMVDGGSHIGFFSHLALASGCSVVAVEPFAPSREFLEHTAVLNGNRDRLTVVPALVSDADSQEGHPFDGWQVAAESESTTSVPSIRLDSVLSTLYPDPSQHRVVYVKLDVEGHEASALAGLSVAVESPAPPLSVYLELTTFDRSVPGSHQEQAEAAARLLERLEAGGKYVRKQKRGGDAHGGGAARGAPGDLYFEPAHLYLLSHSHSLSRCAGTSCCRWRERGATEGSSSYPRSRGTWRS